MVAVFPALAQELPAGAIAFDDDGDGRSDRWEVATGEGTTKSFADTSGDGQFDYILEYDEAGLKKYEALDFNRDGVIDDHYYYARDILKRREIDTNYDGEVDVWVYLKEGIYVERYQRDTDFDGKVDLEKNFGGGE
jgi:hypothetical protein